jgi:hypothetical protein
VAVTAHPSAWHYGRRGSRGENACCRERSPAAAGVCLMTREPKVPEPTTGNEQFQRDRVEHNVRLQGRAVRATHDGRSESRPTRWRPFDQGPVRLRA